MRFPGHRRPLKVFVPVSYLRRGRYVSRFGTSPTTNDIFTSITLYGLTEMQRRKTIFTRNSTSSFLMKLYSFECNVTFVK